MADESTLIPDQTTKEKGKLERPHCGVIMPISGTTDYPANHWADMLQLIQEAAKDAKFTCEIVSATGRDDIIHASIVTNIYQNEIVVCDVSSRNPNVMLELGLRLASKLPLIIIFDGEGNYPFDIGTIRYIGYRKDMRYYDINKFKRELTSKILEVYDTHKKGKYQSFLSHFKNVNFDLDNIGTETQTLKDFMERIDERLFSLERNSNKKSSTSTNQLDRDSENVPLPKGIVEHVRRFVHSNEIDDITPTQFGALLNELADNFSNMNFSAPAVRQTLLRRVILESASRPPF
jgi:hypothetical protein